MIKINLDKAKAIAHDKRRAARAEEFAPLDIKATIPSEAAQAEAARQAIREKYAALQAQMDAAQTPEDPLNIRSDDAEEWEPTGEYDLYPKAGVDLDVIGAIYKPTGETDEEGNPVMEPIDGFHANIRGITDEQAALLPTIAKPNNPVRMWAGD